ncbi:hypothetical protein DFJ74DRAFT_674907 [Hyaloraphidium curvatum]|nr:hypothetical protein DFJ74DRAFT_674907 [Hyaloraphidium curvatum]
MPRGAMPLFRLAAVFAAFAVLLAAVAMPADAWGVKTSDALNQWKKIQEAVKNRQGDFGNMLKDVNGAISNAVKTSNMNIANAVKSANMALKNAEKGNNVRAALNVKDVVNSANAALAANSIPLAGILAEFRAFRDETTKGLQKIKDMVKELEKQIDGGGDGGGGDAEEERK